MAGRVAALEQIVFPIMPPVPAGALLTTLTLVNTSGSTQAANFVTPMFGHPFKKGDIAGASWPKFETTGGTNIPCTIWDKATWSDGSWKHASFVLLVPSSIAGSGSLTINIKGNGTNPGSSGRSLGDLTAQDIKAILVGQDNLSGTWTSSFNTGVSDNDDVMVVGDGPAGKIWRVRQQFMQTGSNHGQLECFWYAAALQNSGAGLYGLRVQGRVVQPWINDTAGTKGNRSFSATLQDGASVLRTMQKAARTFTSLGSNQLHMVAHGLQDCNSFRLSTTGTLPTGLSAGVTYFAGLVDADNITVWDCSQGPISGFGSTPTPAGGTSVGQITISGAGSGTHTLTPNIYIIWGGGCFTCGSDGKWDYIQGGGSVAADATVRVTFDKTYWRSTRVLPPYDLTLTPTAQTLATYNAMDFFGTRALETTGEREEIGVVPAWYGRHFLLQDANGEQTARVAALFQASLSTALYSTATNKIIPVNNSTYTGLGTGIHDLLWRDGQATSGFTDPVGDLTGPFTGPFDTSHWPSRAYYPYLIFGSPDIRDLLHDAGNYAIYNRFGTDPPLTLTNTPSFINTRNWVVGGTTYYGTAIADYGQLRVDAWALRDQGIISGILPDAAVEKPYFQDNWNASMACIVAFNAAQNSFWTTNGIYQFGTLNSVTQPWSFSYLLNAISMGYALTESANALTFLNHLIKFPIAIGAASNASNYTAQQIQIRQGTPGETVPENDGHTALVTAMTDLVYFVAGNTVYTVDSTTDTFTITCAFGNPTFTLTNGDKVKFNSLDSGAAGGTSTNTYYYMRNVSDPGPSSTKTFKLATTPALSDIVDITNSNPGNLYVWMQNFPSSGVNIGLNFVDLASYPLFGERASFRYAEALGVSGISTIRAQFDTMVANTGLSFVSDPKNAYATSF